jgi:hypothetical protein
MQTVRCLFVSKTSSVKRKKGRSRNKKVHKMLISVKFLYFRKS